MLFEYQQGNGKETLNGQGRCLNKQLRIESPSGDKANSFFPNLYLFSCEDFLCFVYIVKWKSYFCH